MQQFTSNHHEGDSSNNTTWSRK